MRPGGFGDAMRRGKPTIVEFSFFLCGVFILLVGWLADLLGIFELGSQPSAHGSANTLPLRLFITIFGVSFATIGIGYENFPEILEDGEAAKRYIIALLFLADGSLHLYAFNDHLGDAFAGTFFGVFSALQLAAAFLIPYGGRTLDPLWVAVTAFLILAYVITRTISVWPIGYVEEVEPLGVASKLVEIVTVLGLLSLMQAERIARRSAVGSSIAGR